MKILLTGGATGGHFYPIIGVAQALLRRAKERKVITPTLFFSGPSQYNPRALFDNELTFVEVPAGKIRRYFSLLNLSDILVTMNGACIALIKVWKIFPDVVFGKGSYASFPTLLAARILGIPVIIHESDSTPGRVNTWAGKFAKRIALSYPDSAKFFDAKKVAVTGNPVRNEIRQPDKHGAGEYWSLSDDVPTILVLGGSQGAQRINDTIIDSIADIVPLANVIHQTGRKNFDEVKRTTDLVLEKSEHKARYKPVPYLDDVAMKYAAGLASLIISRAGSTIFEIALWGAPSIIIPIPTEVSHDQTSNAFAYARAGGCIVIEEKNLAPHVVLSEIQRILGDAALQHKMRDGAKAFAREDSADKIADAILDIALQHEK